MTVDANLSVEEVIKLMFEQTGVRDVYVVAKDNILGHLSHRRLAHLALAEHRREHTRRQIMDRVSAGSAHDLMDRHFATARREEDSTVSSTACSNTTSRTFRFSMDERLVGAVNLTAMLRVMAAQGEV